jgi:DNA-binding transcriptional LysR family regulator
LIDLNELQYFVEVCKEQSFTLAAKRLEVPKSNISRAVLRLEERLGIRLLERTTRRVMLTEVGELYLEGCQRVLEQVQDVDVLIDELQARPRGRLRVGIHVGFFQLFSPPLLLKFLRKYRDLRLQFLTHSAANPSMDRSVDVSILTGPLDDSGLMVKSIVRMQLGTYASPRYLKGREAPTRPADLRQHCCISKSGMSGDHGTGAIWRYRRAAAVEEVRIESLVSLPDPKTLYQLAIDGLGVALLPDSLAQIDVARGHLVRLLPSWQPDPVELFAVYPSRLSYSPKVRAFVQFLQEHLATESFPTKEDRATKRSAGGPRRGEKIASK